MTLGVCHWVPPSCELGSLTGLHCVGWTSWLTGFCGLPVSTSHLTISGLIGAHHYVGLFRWAMGIQAQVFLLANTLTSPTPALFRALSFCSLVVVSV